MLWRICWLRFLLICVVSVLCWWRDWICIFCWFGCCRLWSLVMLMLCWCGCCCLMCGWYLRIVWLMCGLFGICFLWWFSRYLVCVLLWMVWGLLRIVVIILCCVCMCSVMLMCLMWLCWNWWWFSVGLMWIVCRVWLNFWSFGGFWSWLWCLCFVVYVLVLSLLFVICLCISSVLWMCFIRLVFCWNVLMLVW